ncbi:MAG: patatin-like phospholipase family protein, partial [Proteobacteria bacterium]|nr:patatin-like phospholipase family protein [Pseudomonadota bacterium]
LCEKLSIFKVLNPVIPYYGFSGFKKVRQWFEKIGIPKDFSELKIPLIVCATNLSDRKPEYFNNGDLWEALCASIAMPGLFYPVKMGNKLYVDGGITMNLPVSVLKEDCEFIVAVDVNFSGRKYPSLENTYHVIYESLTLMVSRNTLSEREKADFIIDIGFEGIGFLDFKRIKEVIVSGYKDSYAKIGQLRKVLEERNYVQDRGLGPLFVSPLS